MPGIDGLQKKRFQKPGLEILRHTYEGREGSLRVSLQDLLKEIPEVFSIDFLKELLQVFFILHEQVVLIELL